MIAKQTLSKIMTLKENDKKQAQHSYHQAVEVFEKQATSLYKLLKRKEELESKSTHSLHQTIEEFRMQHIYMNKLSMEILTVQGYVQDAREQMELRREKLTDVYIEVKKYEKMIANQQQILNEHARIEENRVMDEISIRQYRGAR